MTNVYPPSPQAPAPKKKHRALKITGAIVGGFIVLGIVVGVTGGGGTPATTPAAAPSTGLTSVCPEPKGTPTPPADGSSVAWDPYTCEWAKLPGTADSVSPAAPVTPAAAPTTEAPQYPPQVEQARSSAQSYLNYTAFSRAGLIRQLSSTAGEGFPKDVATQAVDSLTVDYNAQAAKSAQQYLDYTSFSCSGLTQQLSSSAGEGFTKAQASYGAHQTKACK
jgi:hypothetical protein